MTIAERIADFTRSEYQRDNFDDFLSSVDFSFSLPAIHIAGTNGKGSTASYLASILKNSGYKVGLFMSPWLIRMNEMISINGNLIPDDAFNDYVDRFEKKFRKFELSAFEIQTFAALTYFKEQHCDVAVIECGMGGETDATNIFDSVLSIITSVSLEHTEFLGKSLSEIATNKCGIITPNQPVIIGQLPEEAKTAVVDYAKSRKSKVIETVDASGAELSNEGYKFDYLAFLDNHIQSKALYSVKDACIALEAVAYLSSFFTIPPEAVRSGLAEVEMPCRMSVVKTNPLVIIDGAHNPEGMENLVSSIQKMQINGAIHTVFCCFRDKNITNMISSIGTVSDSLILTTFDHPRARTEMDYFLFLGDYEFREDPIALVREFLERYPNDTILICGSLAFAGFMKDQFDKGVLK